MQEEALHTAESQEKPPIKMVTICGGFTNPSEQQPTNSAVLQSLGRAFAEAGFQVSMGGMLGSLEQASNGIVEHGPGTVDVAVLPNRPHVEPVPGHLTPVPVNTYEERLLYLFIDAEALVFVNPSQRGGTIVEAEHAIQRMIAMIRSDATQPLPPLVFVGEEWNQPYLFDYSFKEHIEAHAKAAFLGNGPLEKHTYIFFVSPEKAVDILRTWQDPRLAQQGS